MFHKTKPLFLQIILALLMVSFGISFFRFETLSMISFVSFGLLALIFLVYIGLQKKWLGVIIPLFAVISILFKSMYWPYGNEIKLAMLIPIICYLLIVSKRKKYLNELSILTIFIGYEVSELISLF